MSAKTERTEEKRKRSVDLESESRKIKQSSIESLEDMENKLAESTSTTPTTHPEINNHHIIEEEARNIMANLQINSIDNIIANSMAKHMAPWQNEIKNTFTNMCTNLVESATRHEARIEKIEEKSDNHNQRISVLEKMTDDMEQTKRGTNIVVRGLKPNPDPKISVINMFRLIHKAPCPHAVIIIGQGEELTKATVAYFPNIFHA